MGVKFFKQSWNFPFQGRRRGGLLPQIKASDQLLIAAGIRTAKVIEKSFALPNHLDQTITGVMILHVGLKMSGETVDAFGEEGNLNFRGTGVLFGALKVGNDFFLFFLR